MILSGLAGIFDRLAELHMSQIELSRRTGIATSTISDWRKKKINPQAKKGRVYLKEENQVKG